MTAGPYSIGSEHWPGISKLIEEAGEVLQVAGKLIATNGESAHWDGTDLRARLVEEIGDLMAACGFVAEANGIADAVLVRMERKAEQFRAWHDEQRCLAEAARLSAGDNHG